MPRTLPRRILTRLNARACGVNARRRFVFDSLLFCNAAIKSPRSRGSSSLRHSRATLRQNTVSQNTVSQKLRLLPEFSSEASFGSTAQVEQCNPLLLSPASGNISSGPAGLSVWRSPDQPAATL
jgi:hypothetical protein